MKRQDCVHRFLFEGSQIRGQVAAVDDCLSVALENKTYPEPLGSLLGQAFSAVALLADTIKIDGSLILQLQGDGLVETLVAQATDKGDIRGLVHWRAEPEPTTSYRELMGNGRLVITIDGEDKQRYQGVVEIIGDTLAESVEAYFQQSEQLETRLWLGSNGSQAGGLLLQQMPEARELSNEWGHFVTLASTLAEDELVKLPGTEIIHRLFHLEDILVYEPSSLQFRCSCSRDKIETVLLQLGEADIMDIVDQDGEVSVDCEFCNLTYGFDHVDISALFRSAVGASSSTH